MRITIVYLLLGSLLFSCQSGPSIPAGDITAEQFEILMAELSDEQILDVRTPEETQGGVIPGAVTIDFFADDFQSQLATLDKTKPVLVYCAAGGRSSQTIDVLKEAGFTQTYNLLDGFRGWKDAGKAVTK